MEASICDSTSSLQIPALRQLPNIFQSSSSVPQLSGMSNNNGASACNKASAACVAAFRRDSGSGLRIRTQALGSYLLDPVKHYASASLLQLHSNHILGK